MFFNEWDAVDLIVYWSSKYLFVLVFSSTLIDLLYFSNKERFKCILVAEHQTCTDIFGGYLKRNLFWGYNLLILYLVLTTNVGVLN